MFSPFSGLLIPIPISHLPSRPLRFPPSRCRARPAGTSHFPSIPSRPHPSALSRALLSLSLSLLPSVFLTLARLSPYLIHRPPRLGCTLPGLHVLCVRRTLFTLTYVTISKTRYIPEEVARALSLAGSGSGSRSGSRTLPLTHRRYVITAPSPPSASFLSLAIASQQLSEILCTPIRSRPICTVNCLRKSRGRYPGGVTASAGVSFFAQFPDRLAAHLPHTPASPGTFSYSRHIHQAAIRLIILSQKHPRSSLALCSPFTTSLGLVPSLDISC